MKVDFSKKNGIYDSNALSYLDNSVNDVILDNAAPFAPTKKDFDLMERVTDLFIKLYS